MINFFDAQRLVLSETREYGSELVHLKDANGRILAEDILADRDFPPYNRATKDGIAIRHEVFDGGRKEFGIEKTVTAGTPPAVLENQDHCIEIMTGAVVPYDTDTVIMYEEVAIDRDIAHVKSEPRKGQNIHLKGSDLEKGSVVLSQGKRIGPAEIGILASVGKSAVRVKTLPRTAVISTGNELVPVTEIPEPHQIRRSNSHSLYSSLSQEGISPLILHLPDDVDIIRQKLGYVIQEMDIVLLSGGVSRGKTDHIPKVLAELGVTTVFHRVAQKPGKPFLFGKAGDQGALVFSFPGNPVSTFVNYYLYFRPWLQANYGLPPIHYPVRLQAPLSNASDLTRFPGVRLHISEGSIFAIPVQNNGSGDLASLSEIDGIIAVPPSERAYEAGELVEFYPCKYHCP